MNKICKKLAALILACSLINICIFSTGATTEEDVKNKLNTTSKYLSGLTVPTVSSVGGEWMVIGLSRNESISDSFVEGYYKNAVNYVISVGSARLDSTKSTENSRMIVALTSIGKDVTNIAGYNLLEPLADFTYIKKQGLNGPVWALIALDTVSYEIPVDDSVSVQTTREKLIDYILDSQLENGGWTFFGSTADPDMTGMTIQSLAPYYNVNLDVKTAVDKALSVLSQAQNDNGGFASWGAENSESCAQVITALTSLGINPETDSRFIKNGNSAVDALMSFGVENGFSHTVNGSYNQMTTEQAYYALVSYSRLLNSKTSLYDMSDLISKYEPPKDINNDGNINILDATEVQKYIAGIVVFTDWQIENSDYNNDGRINILDVTLMQKYYAGLI